jgi:acetyl-CoA synthetase
MTSSAAVGGTAYEQFKAARDLLLQYREDYGEAYAQFKWPTLQYFNWALDWFDAIAPRRTSRPDSSLGDARKRRRGKT